MLNWHGLDAWPQWVLGVGGSLVAAFIIWLLRRLFGSDQKTDGVTVEQNASPTINVPITINGLSNTESYNLAATAVPKKLGNPKRGPHFVYKGYRVKPVFINSYAQHGITDPHDTSEYERAIQALIFRFENAPHDIGARAINVIAKILFRSVKGTSEEAVGYGVWLNSPCNCTEMEIGDTRELVLICQLEDKLLSIDDRRESNHHFHSEWSWMDTRPVDGLEIAEIRLIETQSGATKTFNFHIGCTDGGFEVNQMS